MRELDIMCEWLIYIREDGLDSLSLEEIQVKIGLNPNFAGEYNARTQKGDYIECRENGYWSGKNGKGFNKNAFELLLAPEMLVEDGQKFCEPIWNITDEGEDTEDRTLVKSRKCNVNRDTLSYTMNKYGGKIATISKTGLEYITVDKVYDKTIAEQKIIEASK